MLTSKEREAIQARKDLVAELERAAALMRERAEAVPGSPWQWCSPGGGWPQPVRSLGDDDVLVADCGFSPGSAPDVAQYVASWHPDVALAVADWLDAEANALSSWETNSSGMTALGVARAYMSTAPGSE